MAKKKSVPLVGELFSEKQLRSKSTAWGKALIFATLALAYLFWPVDILPDLIGPVVGYVDDAIIILFSGMAIRGAIKTIMSNKRFFLGGK